MDMRGQVLGICAGKYLLHIDVDTTIILQQCRMRSTGNLHKDDEYEENPERTGSRRGR